jgi:hypothetical protein
MWVLNALLWKMMVKSRRAMPDCSAKEGAAEAEFSHFLL